MPRRMQDFDAPFSKVDVFTAAQHLRRCSLKKRIVVYIITVRQLAALGYLDASPDGIFGDSTAAAIRSFQADHGVVTSGIATTETQQALFSEESMANAF